MRLGLEGVSIPLVTSLRGKQAERGQSKEENDPNAECAP